jgi:LysM repeat protein
MKLIFTVLSIGTLFVQFAVGQTSSDVIAYVNNYKELAMNEMQRTGIPAAVILAQGIHETQAGTSDLVRKSNNHFGIKCKDNWSGPVVYHDDDRAGECFRSYESPKDSYVDHSDFLRNSPRYQFLFKLGPENYRAWAYGLKKAGYATNSKYPEILIRLIEDYNLEQYTLIAMGKIPASREIALGPSSPAAAPMLKLPVLDPAPSPPRQYPEGEFKVNNTRVIYAKAGQSLLAVSEQNDLPLARLLEFNDLSEEDVLVRDQLLFLQRKRKTGAAEIHTVQEGETLYDISQQEGIRLENLTAFNLLFPGQEPAAGEKIYCQFQAPSRPVLREEKNRVPAADARTGATQDGKEKGTPIVHIVQAKETLFSISQKYGVDIQKIQEWNKLDSVGLRTGQELLIYKN